MLGAAWAELRRSARLRTLCWALVIGLAASLLAFRRGAPAAAERGASAASQPPGVVEDRASVALRELVGSVDACRATSAEGARRVGTLLERQGRAHAESSRVRPTDGPRAVRQLAESAACFRAAGDVVRAEELRAFERDVRLDLERRIRSLGLGFERAKKNAQHEVALTELRRLLALFEGSGGEYAAWLAQEERRLRDEKTP